MPAHTEGSALRGAGYSPAAGNVRKVALAA